MTWISKSWLQFMTAVTDLYTSFFDSRYQGSACGLFGNANIILNGLAMRFLISVLRFHVFSCSDISFFHRCHFCKKVRIYQIDVTCLIISCLQIVIHNYSSFVGSTKLQHEFLIKSSLN